MFRLFRPSPRARTPALAMIDPRPGDRVGFTGADDPRLAAETGTITGLNGQTVVAARDSADAARVERAAAAAGALIECHRSPDAALPLEEGTFDIVVVPRLAVDVDQARDRLTSAVRAIRPGGRLIVIAGERRAGWLARVTAPAAALPTDTVLALMTAAGTVAARRLAESGGLTFYESRRPREQPSGA